MDIEAQVNEAMTDVHDRVACIEFVDKLGVDLLPWQRAVLLDVFWPVSETNPRR